MRKIITLCLSVLCLWLLCSPSVVSAKEEGIFSVNEVEGKAGEQVRVVVSSKENPGIVSLNLELSYDDTVLKLVSRSEGVFSPMMFGQYLTSNPMSMVWVDAINPNNTSNGVVAEFVFEILEGAPVGKTDITLSYDPENVYDIEFENVSFGIENGGVRVLAEEQSDTEEEADKKTEENTGESSENSSSETSDTQKEDKKDTPNTADEHNIVLWMLLLVVSCVGVLSLYFGKNVLE